MSASMTQSIELCLSGKGLPFLMCMESIKANVGITAKQIIIREAFSISIENRQ